MSLPAGVILAADLISNLDALTTTLTAQARNGQKDFNVPLTHAALLTTTPEPARVVDFTAPDDLELRAIRVSATSTAAGQTVTIALTQTDGDNAYLLDFLPTITVTTVVGTAHATLDLRTTTQAIRLRLLRGVQYRMTATTSAAANAPQVSAALVLRTRRRRR